MRWVGLIPARGGSKGIHKKSIALCAGKPLLAYTAEAAQGARKLNRVIVSTDDEEIARTARELGLDAPFLRPSEFASDGAPMAAVMKHALEWLNANGDMPDALVLLQPTSPLRSARHIDECISRFEETQAESLVSVMEVPHSCNPISVLKMAESGQITPYLASDTTILRRQDKPRVFARNGPAILIVRSELIRKGQLYGESTIGYRMDKVSSLDVDDESDLRLAELLLRNPIHVL